MNFCKDKQRSIMHHASKRCRCRLPDRSKRTISLRCIVGSFAGREQNRCRESSTPVLVRGFSYCSQEKDRLPAGTGRGSADRRIRPPVSAQPDSGTPVIRLFGTGLHQQHLQNAGAGSCQTRHGGGGKLPDCRKRQRRKHITNHRRRQAVIMHHPEIVGKTTRRTEADCLCCCRRRQSH